MKWADYFYYDETSPSCLRWAVDVRSGEGEKVVNCLKGDVAGSPNRAGYDVQLHSKLYRTHRVIWEMLRGEIPFKKVIDHIDGNNRNNVIDNLRVVTSAVNSRNGKMRSNSTSGVTGVNYHKGTNAWVARWYDLNGKQKQRSYSCSVYGDKAKSLAEIARNEAIQALNAEGAGYTERHGK